MTEKKDDLIELKKIVFDFLEIGNNIEGSYHYILTRQKSAFSVGTVGIDDFEEITEEEGKELVECLTKFICSRFVEKEKFEELEKVIEQFDVYKELNKNMPVSRLLNLKTENEKLKQSIMESIDNCQTCRQLKEDRQDRLCHRCERFNSVLKGE